MGRGKGMRGCDNKRGCVGTHRGGADGARGVLGHCGTNDGESAWVIWAANDREGMEC